MTKFRLQSSDSSPSHARPQTRNMVPSVGITGIFRRDQLVGGVHSVFENLTLGFSELICSPSRDRDVGITVFHGPAESVRRDERLTWCQVPNRFGRFLTESRIALREGRQLDALLFINYHTPLVVRAGRAVTIIHDLQWRHLPEFYGATKRLWLNWAHLVTLKKCRRVVAISQAVKDDILLQYGDRWENHIEVIWNPVCVERFENGSGRDFTGGRPYVLCVAVDRPQKNLFRLIQAFAQVREKHREFCLVLAGQLRSLRRDPRERTGVVAQTMPSAADLVERLQIADHVRVTGFISDQELGCLYRGATMCVLPSLFEGFGMTAVESMAMGKPTLVSGLPVLREITFHAAQYLDDPTDVGAMAEAIDEIITSSDRYRPDARIMEKMRIAFSPQTIAQQYLRVLTQ